MNKRIVTAGILFGFVFLLVFLLGRYGNNVIVKDRLYQNGYFSFKSDEALMEKEVDGFDIYFENLRSDVLVFGRGESKKDLSLFGFNDLSLEDYSKTVYENLGSKLESLKLYENKKFYYFTYRNSENTEDVFYVYTIFESNDKFWLISFASKYEKRDEYKDKFLKWASTIEFK